MKPGRPSEAKITPTGSGKWSVVCTGGRGVRSGLWRGARTGGLPPRPPPASTSPGEGDGRGWGGTIGHAGAAQRPRLNPIVCRPGPPIYRGDRDEPKPTAAGSGVTAFSEPWATRRERRAGTPRGGRDGRGERPAFESGATGLRRSAERIMVRQPPTRGVGGMSRAG